MPNYKGHLVGGLVAYIFMLLVIGISSSLFLKIEWLLCALAGSLFPDVDIKSKGQKYFYYVILLNIFYLWHQGNFKAISCCSFVIIVPMIVRHRGIFHNLMFILGLSLGVCFLVSRIIPSLSYYFFVDMLFFIAGAISHVWLDIGLYKMIKPFMFFFNRKNRRKKF